MATAYVLVLFLKPAPGRHGGINQYDRAKFIEMVDGTAFKPFVYRALLPLTTRIIVSITPYVIQRETAAFVEKDDRAHKTFELLGWEIDAAYEFLVASLLMYLCFAGFAHYAAKLTIITCRLQDNVFTRTALAVLTLYGLPPFFRYVSYVYDPPQLFLFTASLYFLAKPAVWRFLFLFILTTLNKETSILLIPIYAIFCRDHLSKRRYLTLLVMLIAAFVSIKGALHVAFHGNPGTFVELHLFDHNLNIRTIGAVIRTSGYFALLLILSCIRWNRRPRFLKIALLSTLPPLVLFTWLFGFIDEWRDYYEAYPTVFALVINFFFGPNGPVENRDSHDHRRIKPLS